jgi:hypothetical protein
MAERASRVEPRLGRVWVGEDRQSQQFGRSIDFSAFPVGFKTSTIPPEKVMRTWYAGVWLEKLCGLWVVLLVGHDSIRAGWSVLHQTRHGARPGNMRGFAARWRYLALCQCPRPIVLARGHQVWVENPRFLLKPCGLLPSYNHLNHLMRSLRFIRLPRGRFLFGYIHLSCLIPRYPPARLGSKLSLALMAAHARVT